MLLSDRFAVTKLVALCLLAIACTASPSTSDHACAVTGSDYDHTCGSDSDCKPVDLGDACCPNAAINVDSFSQYEADRAACPRSNACNLDCVSRPVACVSGVCKLQ